MKKVLLTMLVVFMAQSSFAAVDMKAKEAVRKNVENNETVKELLKEQASGKDYTKNPVLMGKIAKMLEIALKDVVAYDQVKLLSLIAVDPVTAMTEIGHISKQLKDPAVTEARKSQLKKQLELIMESSSYVNATARTEQEAQKNKAELKDTMELAENLSHMDFKSAEPMMKKVETLLKSKSLGKAIDEAGKGAGKDGKDITTKEVKENC